MHNVIIGELRAMRSLALEAAADVLEEVLAPPAPATEAVMAALSSIWKGCEARGDGAYRRRLGTELVREAIQHRALPTPTEAASLIDVLLDDTLDFNENDPLHDAKTRTANLYAIRVLLTGCIYPARMDARSCLALVVRAWDMWSGDVTEGHYIAMLEVGTVLQRHGLIENGRLTDKGRALLQREQHGAPR
ncbi:MAG: hypothetical protein ACTHU0_21545 [Kofleriaceae bacterium]